MMVIADCNMTKNVDVVSEEIDELMLRKLELMEEKVYGNIQMETLLKDGHIELAKAKYIRGKENISMLQVPNNEDTVTSLFDLETKTTNEDNDTVPSFDISFKKLSDDADGPGDPIKWFGVLVPQNLRNSQKRFQESVYLAAKIANVQAELTSVISKIKTLHIQKDNLCSPNGIKT
ncbi:PREDICTED: coiled-coil domain-containing protein 115 [Wasmannia auropunctata]|uniref:coiled-coil domain-containing protein 115 n=1 Tax=Wasmannia auropunctata TaxID=64793 RepID=UPI0005ED5860|nr:PREDICTED: coiled-coil domain-containing protein 115 [Wasmannia auropunctata]XP_011697220.1 PREDICTED: coiled-coil domain-containing protein 115 [Wasmannia auropunctata]